MRYFYFVFLILTVAIFSQEKAKTENGKLVILHPDGSWEYDSTQTNNSLGNLTIPTKREFNHPPFSRDLSANYYLEEKYDKYKDFSSVNMILKLNQLKADLSIGAYFIYTGKTLTTPTQIVLRFVSKSKDWEYLRNSILDFLVDGNRIRVGEMKRDGTVGSGYVLEFLTIKIPVETFLEIINGTNVEGKLFTTEFKLTEQQLEAFRDFASRMQ